MSIADIRLIAAVGRRGQLGLDDELPWRDPVDLAFFRNNTTFCTVIVGRRTAEAVGTLPKRHVAIWDGKEEPAAFLAGIKQPHWAKGSPIWIAGGARTYRAFMPLVRTCVITRIDYDGPADTWMPPLWEPAR
ncbi:dihydrofolate reductase [Azorhizobium doebereinerae]|uniref:dihydrofolate reductase n=1 Tax=Azorhizobium doebereinerae TaxID=281091 RepID=UPI0004139AD7|nr:dihydrofolate reductase [Azorhizobium doebereinerae]